MITQGRAELAAEVEKLKNELNELHNKYDLLLESSASYFVIYENDEVIEFSPKAEEKFIFPSDFSDKSIEELMPIFQVDGERSIISWQKHFKLIKAGKTEPFEFEFLDRNGKSFAAIATISLVKNERYLVHFDLVENTENIASSANSIADNAPVFIKITDEKNKATYFNKGWFELLNLDRSEIYESWINHIHPDDLQNYISTVEFSISNKKNYELSFRIKDVKNSFKWLQETGTPRYSKNKKFIGYISAAIDVTARKALDVETTREKAISESEFKIQDSLNESEVVALTTNTDGIITFCNKTLLDTLQTEKNEIVGANLFELFIPEANLNQKKYGQIGQPGHHTGTIAGKFFSKEKDEINVRFNVIVLKDALNEVSSISLIGENETERKQIKKQLEKSNDQLEELFDNSYDLIQTFDYEGKFQFVNQAWIEKLGYTGKLEQMRFKDLVDQDSWQATVTNLDKIIKGEHIDRFETVLTSDMGKKIFVSGRVNCSFDMNGKAQFRGIFYDITERRRAEKAQSLYYKIADFNTEGPQLTILYGKLFDELHELLNVRNLSIQLKLDDRSPNTAPFIRSEFVDDSKILKQKELSIILSDRTNSHNTHQTIVYEEEILNIIQEKRGFEIGDIPKVWLGARISIGSKNLGLLSISSYQDRSDFGAKDLDLLHFVSSQISLAIERKINEEKINDQAARLKAIFESSSHKIWSIDNKYNLTAFNHNFATAIAEDYGVTATTGIGFAKELLKVPQTVNEFWEKKYIQAFKGKTLNFHNELTNKLGEKRWNEVFINPILKEDGLIDEVSVISNDITEKKTAELALLESESKFREIFDSIQDIYFRCNLHGSILLISPSVKEYLGLNPKEMIGENIADYFNTDQSNGSILRLLLREHQLQNLEAIHLTKEDQIVNFICNVRVLFRNKQVIGFEGVARDFTSIIKTNQELKKSKDIAEKSLAIKEQFLANMSHEIRTPMNGIVGMIDLMASTNLDTEQYDYIKTIKKSSGTLMDILDDILDLSKIEAGKMELKEKPCNLISVFEKLYDLFSKEAKANHLTLSYNLSKSTPNYVLLDETRFFQILSNLVSNAIKFSEKTGIIDISLQPIKQSKKTCKFKVQIKDEGIGIPKEDIKNLFINFNQLDNSTTKVYSGTGLGLAISKELVGSMNGDIGVASTPGLGSTFWFTFDAKMVNSDEAILHETDNLYQIETEFTQRIPAILVVDDNKVNRKVASQILEKAGCDVDQASSGFEAIELVKYKSYDLIFMDIQMPNMDGLEATTNIKALDIKHLPPIIAMTAYSMEDDRERFLSQGMDDYLAKPIKALSIINKVKEYVSFELEDPSSTSPNPTPDDQLINPEVLAELAKFGGPELLDSIFSDFELEAAELINNCFVHFISNDLESIRKELHTLKGSAGTLGLIQLTDLVTSLEFQLKSSKTTNLKPQLDNIKSSYDEFKKKYKAILEL